MTTKTLARIIHDTYWCLWDDFNVPPPLDRCGWDYLSPKQQGVMGMLAGEIKHIFKEELND